MTIITTIIVVLILLFLAPYVIRLAWICFKGAVIGFMVAIVYQMTRPGKGM